MWGGLQNKPTLLPSPPTQATVPLRFLSRPRRLPCLQALLERRIFRLSLAFPQCNYVSRVNPPPPKVQLSHQGQLRGCGHPFFFPGVIFCLHFVVIFVFFCGDHVSCAFGSVGCIGHATVSGGVSPATPPPLNQPLGWGAAQRVQVGCPHFSFRGGECPTPSWTGGIWTSPGGGGPEDMKEWVVCLPNGPHLPPYGGMGVHRKSPERSNFLPWRFQFFFGSFDLFLPQQCLKNYFVQFLQAIFSVQRFAHTKNRPLWPCHSSGRGSTQSPLLDGGDHPVPTWPHVKPCPSPPLSPRVVCLNA